MRHRGRGTGGGAQGRGTGGGVQGRGAGGGAQGEGHISPPHIGAYSSIILSLSLSVVVTLGSRELASVESCWLHSL